ncbi:hypothetical protein SteCoe_39427 [Stentor coeruleus]|uniref:Tyrosine-protein kinase ephrin type A/B receptor-like domain-containing protein n=1 Tax=Stentor coeruleus TaxID=5963 RepID=A0A1R2AKP7_9CILI|nr:hypothetical protein SteCoe_39427 [Stentor coeruleus]
MESCIPCPSGTYNSNKGGSSYRQCYPCQSGTFNNKEGSSICYDCPIGFDCPMGSKDPVKIVYTKVESSIQPKIYSTESSEKITSIYIISASVSLLIVLILLFTFKKIRDKIKNADLYTEMHNHELLVPMIKKKNTIGGFFSLVFIIAAVVYIGSAIIEFSKSNIQESKVLVPLIILENESELLTANKIIVTSKIIGYGGECGVEGICNSQIFINITNLSGSLIEYNCTNYYGNICIVTIVCNNCALLGEATIFITTRELKSYASAIFVNITSDSSIPGEVSNINNELYSSEDYIFIGSEANEFYCIMIPSLFTSESSRWPSRLTGYHISNEKLNLKGSEALKTDLPVNAGFKIFIYMSKSSNGLYTQRLFKQNILILVSSIIGSVFGIMSFIGFFMELTEGLLLKFNKNQTKIKGLLSIISKRKEIGGINFGNNKEILNKK